MEPSVAFILSDLKLKPRIFKVNSFKNRINTYEEERSLRKWKLQIDYVKEAFAKFNDVQLTLLSSLLVIELYLNEKFSFIEYGCILCYGTVLWSFVDGHSLISER